MPLKKQIQALLASDYRGPKAAYGEVDILKALLAIGKSRTNLGRTRLGQLTGLGQGEVRTLIARLKTNGLIEVDAKGASLTEKGKREFAGISKTLPYSSQVEAKPLGLGKFAWSIIVRDNQNKIRTGIEQRDASIRVGADGAITVIYSSGKFMIPSLDKKSANADCEALGPSEPWTTIRSEGKPKNGDVVIVSWANSILLAEAGALSGALTIL
jgi:predicted transcriptional regulator